MTQDKPTSCIFASKPNETLPYCIGVAKDGQWIILEDPITGETKEVYDAISGAAVSSLPHNDPDIISQYNKFASESTYTTAPSFTNKPAEELAKHMVSKSNGVFASARFVCSGSEANDNAFRIIKQYFLEKGKPNKHKFISRVNSYHGLTIGALSVGDNPDKPLFENILLNKKTQSVKISPVYPYRDIKPGNTAEEYCKALLDEAEQTILSNDPDTIAAIVVETVSGHSLGTTVPPSGYLPGLKSLAQKYDLLLMLDEVMCGLGRCGYPYTFMNPEFGFGEGEGPDIMTFGKTIGAGLVSLSGVMISPKIVDAVEQGSGLVSGYQTYHSHHFNCAVALAVQQKIYALNLFENVRETGAYLKNKLNDELKDCKVFGEVRGIGNFLSVEIVKDKETKEPFPPELKMYKIAYSKLMDRNGYFMCIPGCAGSKVVDGSIVSLGDHFTMAPAFTFTIHDADFIVDCVKGALMEIEKEYL